MDTKGAMAEPPVSCSTMTLPCCWYLASNGGAWPAILHSGAGTNGKGGDSGQITVSIQAAAPFFISKESKALAFVARKGAGGIQTAFASGGRGGQPSLPACGGICYFGDKYVVRRYRGLARCLLGRVAGGKKQKQNTLPLIAER